jgi:TfoX/Sxy family transcriptional regulator of competence genes
MSEDQEFKTFVLDQLVDLGAFETKAMFGGTALLVEGTAFAKVKHGALWLKVSDANRTDFLEKEMPQYTYGKDNARKLNFFKTPPALSVDSTDRRNTLSKLLSWGLILQGLAWSFVELACNRAQFSLRMNREIGSSGQILP